ncbi:MAG: hypothetical protein HOJ16_05445 [Candidatus Peribacter sp.]|nr:hypothetical protein [Candidatus Peribacter sp.]
MTTPNTPDSGIGLYDGADAISNMTSLMDPGMDTPEEQVEAVADEASVTDEELVYEASEESVETDEQDQNPVEEEEQPDVYTVRVNGEDVEVTLDELTKGYSRQSDYQRKTQEVAEQRRAVEKQYQEAQASIQNTQQLEQQYAALLGPMAQQLQADNQPEPDWNSAYEADPIEATKLERQYRVQKEERAKKLQAIQSEQQRLMQESKQRQQVQYQQHLVDQQKLLLEAIPEWVDEKVRDKEVSEMRTWMVESGRFTPEQVNQVSFAGHVVSIRESYMFSRGQAKVQEKRKAATSKKGKTIRPGSKAGAPAQSTAVKNAAGKLQQTGSYRDAADLLLELDLD